MSETKIQSAIMKALAADPDVLVWRNNTGAVKAQSGRFLRFGLGVGSADIVGLIRSCKLTPRMITFKGPQASKMAQACESVVAESAGRFFALEVKVPGGTISNKQDEWGASVSALGGFYHVVMSVEDALRAVHLAKQGFST